MSRKHPFSLAVLMVVIVLAALMASTQQRANARIPPEDVPPIDSSPEANKALIIAMFAAMSGVEKPLALQNQFITSLDLKQHISLFETAFPRYQMVVHDMIAEGDEVAVRATFKGTQQGEFAGIAAGGQTVELPIMGVYQVKNGKIARFWIQADMLALIQQLQPAGV